MDPSPKIGKRLPSPFGIPIIGNGIQLLLSPKQRNYEILEEIASKFDSPIVGLRFGMNNFVMSVLVGALTLAIPTLRVAITLHSRMLQRILRAPMSFFDTTPLGRLVNRFAMDVDTADLMIPLNIRAFINILLSVLSTFIVISYATPVFIAFMVKVKLKMDEWVKV